MLQSTIYPSLMPLFFGPWYAHDRLFGPNCSNRIEIQGIVVKGYNIVSTTLTAQPIDARAYSTSSRRCRCCARSTNRNRNFDRRNATVHRPDSEANGTSSRRSTARPDDSVSAEKKNKIETVFSKRQKKNEYKNSFASFNANLNFFTDRCKLIETFFSFFFYTLFYIHSFSF